MSTTGPEQWYAAATAIDRIARAHRAAASSALGDVGLSESTAVLLLALSNTAPCTMSRAAELLSCDRSNITLLATQLESRGLVERVPDQLDARRRNLEVTAAGERVAQRLRRVIAAESPLRHLDADQYAELVTLLHASLVAEGAGRAEPASAPPGS